MKNKYIKNNTSIIGILFRICTVVQTLPKVSIVLTGCSLVSGADPHSTPAHVALSSSRLRGTHTIQLVEEFLDPWFISRFMNTPFIKQLLQNPPSGRAVVGVGREMLNNVGTNRRVKKIMTPEIQKFTELFNHTEDLQKRLYEWFLTLNRDTDNPNVLEWMIKVLSQIKPQELTPRTQVRQILEARQISLLLHQPGLKNEVVLPIINEAIKRHLSSSGTRLDDMLFGTRYRYRFTQLVFENITKPQQSQFLKYWLELVKQNDRIKSLDVTQVPYKLIRSAFGESNCVNWDYIEFLNKLLEILISQGRDLVLDFPRSNDDYLPGLNVEWLLKRYPTLPQQRQFLEAFKNHEPSAKEALHQLGIKINAGYWDTSIRESEPAQLYAQSSSASTTGNTSPTSDIRGTKTTRDSVIDACMNTPFIKQLLTNNYDRSNGAWRDRKPSIYIPDTEPTVKEIIERETTNLTTLFDHPTDLQEKLTDWFKNLKRTNNPEVLDWMISALHLIQPRADLPRQYNLHILLHLLQISLLLHQPGMKELALPIATEVINRAAIPARQSFTDMILSLPFDDLISKIAYIKPEQHQLVENWLKLVLQNPGINSLDVLEVPNLLIQYSLKPDYTRDPEIDTEKLDFLNQCLQILISQGQNGVLSFAGYSIYQLLEKLATPELRRIFLQTLNQNPAEHLNAHRIAIKLNPANQAGLQSLGKSIMDMQSSTLTTLVKSTAAIGRAETINDPLVDQLMNTWFIKELLTNSKYSSSMDISEEKEWMITSIDRILKQIPDHISERAPYVKVRDIMEAEILKFMDLLGPHNNGKDSVNFKQALTNWFLNLRQHTNNPKVFEWMIKVLNQIKPQDTASCQWVHILNVLQSSLLLHQPGILSEVVLPIVNEAITRPSIPDNPLTNLFAYDLRSLFQYSCGPESARRQLLEKWLKLVSQNPQIPMLEVVQTSVNLILYSLHLTPSHPYTREMHIDFLNQCLEVLISKGRDVFLSFPGTAARNLVEMPRPFDRAEFLRKLAEFRLSAEYLQDLDIPIQLNPAYYE